MGSFFENTLTCIFNIARFPRNSGKFAVCVVINQTNTNLDTSFVNTSTLLSAFAFLGELDDILFHKITISGQTCLYL